MRLRETTNEYGTPVAEYRCQTCGEIFTICPAPEPEKDDQWKDCLARECSSYDESRDIDKWFEDGRVRSIDNPDGSKRLVRYKIIDGGKP
jgi:hypothetical protein